VRKLGIHLKKNTMENTKKLSLEELKAKAGKASVNANAVNGGIMAACHLDSAV
jgi:hypothetical protein